MYLKLTYYNSVKIVLVNMDLVKYISRVYDSRLEKYSTKLTFKTGSKQKGKSEYINVSESLQTIMSLINDYRNGFSQNTNWQDIDFFETEEFENF